jgi:hypothetical protein
LDGDQGTLDSIALGWLVCGRTTLDRRSTRRDAEAYYRLPRN